MFVLEPIIFRELSIASGLTLRINYLLHQLSVKETTIDVTGEELLSIYKPGEGDNQGSTFLRIAGDDLILYLQFGSDLMGS